MSNLHKSEAIVLKKKQLLQKDVMITFLTKDLGKLTAVAKGIKKITSKRAPHIQTGHLVNISLSQKTDRYYLQDSQLVSGFMAIKDNNQKMNYLYTFLFILDRLLPEHQVEERTYKTTKAFLTELARTPDFTKEQFISYWQKILEVLGYTHRDLPLEELIIFTENLIQEKLPGKFFMLHPI